MAKFKYSMTPAKLRRFKRGRRGEGERASYRPWLTVSDVPSRGRLHRVSRPASNFRGRGWARPTNPTYELGRCARSVTTRPVMQQYAFALQPGACCQFGGTSWI